MRATGMFDEDVLRERLRSKDTLDTFLAEARHAHSHQILVQFTRRHLELAHAPEPGTNDGRCARLNLDSPRTRACQHGGTVARRRWVLRV